MTQRTRMTVARACFTALFRPSCAMRWSSLSTSGRSRPSASLATTSMRTPKRASRCSAMTAIRSPRVRSTAASLRSENTERRSSATTVVSSLRRSSSRVRWVGDSASAAASSMRYPKDARSWATPSCISRARRWRSSAVADSRTAENTIAVSSWSAAGRSTLATAARAASISIRSGSIPAPGARTARPPRWRRSAPGSRVRCRGAGACPSRRSRGPSGPTRRWSP